MLIKIQKDINEMPNALSLNCNSICCSPLRITFEKLLIKNTILKPHFDYLLTNFKNLNGI